ncbi:MAG: AAA family ATPase, partial [Thermofilaceae archaeon]
DRLVYVPPPDKTARLEILKVHTKRMPLAEDVDLERLAEATEGYTGADLANLCREAAILTLREAGKPVKVQMKYFLKALETIRSSVSKEDLEKYKRIAEEFKRILA